MIKYENIVSIYGGNMNSKELINKAGAGFNTLSLPDKYKKSALESLEEWLTDIAFKDYRGQIEYLINQEKWGFLLDAFYQVIPFGTGGRRGLVGIGPNRINTWTIQSSAQGHSQYLIKEFGEDAKKSGVVLTFDVREFNQKGVYDDSQSNPVMGLNCLMLARGAAQVYAANGIKVYLFDDVRSTPELSYAIRYLKASSGDMFSASHNAPSDNGKKVYDQYGGQLIPPFDQYLVDEVTQNVKDIKITGFDQAVKDGLIEIVGKEIDEAYINIVCAVSLSDQRDVKIVYSPLHGTGLTSIYPILTKLGYDVQLDPKTKNLSGAFENVTFNIPNPEVTQSFDNSLIFAKEQNADILLSSDPDADRIGIMVNHKSEWHYLNGNEIGIILTDYGIGKYKELGKLNDNSTIIKTAVTSTLIQKIADENKVNCIGDLLVGFKYVGEEMNKLTELGKMKDFILGTEESHGFIMGDYARDKDAAAAAVWLCEMAAEKKKQGKTLLDYLNEIYAKYGYCHNYLTEIRLPGADGMGKIVKIMDYFRDHKVDGFGKFTVEKVDDRWQGESFKSETDKSSRNVLIFIIKPIENTYSIKVTLRPSGTEPKIKMYFEVLGNSVELSNIDEEKLRLTKLREEFEREFMKSCYKVLGVEFPDRGFLLFWQLPLADKMKYFEIEKDIVALKDVTDQITKKQKLEESLKFLGSNPVEKVNNAFKAEYGQDLITYIGL
jgi:phosphoglucomutase/phosphomannomutase